MKLLSGLSRNEAMKIMNRTSPTAEATFLRTEDPVIPVNPAAWGYLPEVEGALRRGVAATADAHRAGFYEIEIGDTWYYVHVPKRLRAVYLVAAQKRPSVRKPEPQARQHAC